MQNNSQQIAENSIDLRELFFILQRRKKLIWSITTLFTLIALLYVFIAKPTYRGSAMLEIGEVVNNNVVVNNTLENTSELSTIFYLDNIYNLKNITSMATDVIINIPKKTTNILQLSYEDNNKELIKKKLESSVKFVIDRHKGKAELYKNNNAKVKMTQLVGKIKIGEKSIKPKKKLIIIVTFITGLIFAVFLAFFLEFLRGMKREDSQ